MAIALALVVSFAAQAEAKDIEASIVVPVEVSNIMSEIHDLKVTCEILFLDSDGKWRLYPYEPGYASGITPVWGVPTGGGVHNRDFKFQRKFPDGFGAGQKLRYTCYLTANNGLPVLFPIIDLTNPAAKAYPSPIEAFWAREGSTFLPHLNKISPFPIVGIEGEMEFAPEIRTSPIKWIGEHVNDLSVSKISNNSAAGVQAAQGLQMQTHSGQGASDSVIGGPKSGYHFNLNYTAPETGVLSTFTASPPSRMRVETIRMTGDGAALNQATLRGGMARAGIEAEPVRIRAATIRMTGDNAPPRTMSAGSERPAGNTSRSASGGSGGDTPAKTVQPSGRPRSTGR